MVPSNIATRLSTDAPLFQDIIGNIDKGEIKIPQFQRKFVWKAEQAISLLDSLARNYPIGSLLLWKTSDKLATERNIGDFQLPATDDLSPTSYVLDGQQRITVIYSALAPVQHPGFSASYDLSGQFFLPTPADPAVYIFPLRRLYNTTQLLNFRTALQTHPDADELQRRLDDLVAVLTRYRIPVVELRDLSLEEVCPIFERINSSGTALSTYDLMVAATWSQHFDLNDRVDDITLSLAPKGFDDLSRDTVLKVLSAIQTRSIRRDSILALRRLSAKRMDDLVAAAKLALQNAVDLLSAEFRVHSVDFLPYEAHIVICAYVFSKTAVLNQDQMRRMKQWFWRTAFRDHYRGASENVITRDLDTIHQFVLDARGISSEADADRMFGQPPDVRDLLAMRFRKNSAGSRAYALALGKAEPRNLTNGATIDTYAALSAYNKKQFHHIFPEAFLRRADAAVERDYILNICLLTASENNAVSDEDPRLYLERCAHNLGSSWQSVLSSNLLPTWDALTDAVLAKDEDITAYSAFLLHRAREVEQFVGALCSGGR